MTVLQALSSAGFTQFANLKSIYLLRTQNGQQTKIPFRYKDALKGKDTQSDLILKPGDTIVVP
jgi:polysaccharide export outer membrane protein